MGCRSRLHSSRWPATAHTIWRFASPAVGFQRVAPCDSSQLESLSAEGVPARAAARARIRAGCVFFALAPRRGIVSASSRPKRHWAHLKETPIRSSIHPSCPRHQDSLAASTSLRRPNLDIMALLPRSMSISANVVGPRFHPPTPSSISPPSPSLLQHTIAIEPAHPPALGSPLVLHTKRSGSP